MGRGVRAILGVLRTAQLPVRILTLLGSLGWIGIGMGTLLVAGPTLFIPLLVWVIFTVMILSVIGDLAGG